MPEERIKFNHNLNWAQLILAPQAGHIIDEPVNLVGAWDVDGNDELRQAGERMIADVKRRDKPPAVLGGYKSVLFEDMPEGPKLDRAPFIPDYDTYEDVMLRLNHSLINIRGMPWWVTAINREPFGLYLEDGTQAAAIFMEYKPGLDLRTVPGGYFNSNQQACWLSRHPARNQKQGMCDGNTSVYNEHGENMGFSGKSLIPALRKRKLWRWDNKTDQMLRDEILSSLALSTTIAVVSQKDELLAFYKSRELGVVVDDIVKAEKEDADMSWIRNDLGVVGLELRG